MTEPDTHPRLREAVALFSAMRRVTGRRFWGAFALLALSNVTEGMSILLLLPILHLANTQGGDFALDLAGRSLLGVPLPDVTLSLGVLLAALVLLVAIQALFNRWKAIYLSRVLFDFVNDLRAGLFRSIAAARWDAVVRVRAADLEHALTGEIERNQAAGFQVLNMLQVTVALAIFFCLSLLISVPMTLFAFGFGIAAFVALYPFRRLAAGYGTKIVGNLNDQYRIVSEFLAGLKMAKSMNLEPAYARQFDRSLERMKRDATDYVSRSSIGTAAFQVSSAIGAVAFVYVALKVVGLPFVDMIVLLLILLRVAPRFLGLQGQAQQLLLNLSSYRRVSELKAQLDADREVSAVAADLPRLSRGVALQDVSFRYAGADDASTIHGLSLMLEAGRITALIGRSGSGKSTVADLLMGLITPASGQVLLDGKALSAEHLKSWRSQIAYVPQETFLLHDTILANLTLVAPDATEQEIDEALKAAHAADFVAALPHGLGTVVGDRGARLSGGERQRIALARALLQKPSLLILDEATSALDWQGQAAVADAIRALVGKVTVLTIAHRPSMVAFADQIYTIESGRIVESGTARELKNNGNSHFARMMAHETSETA